MNECEEPKEDDKLRGTDIAAGTKSGLEEEAWIAELFENTIEG